MTSLGRLIFFDQPGTGASDPVTADAMPTLEQWADSITAVLDDLDSREAVLISSVFSAVAPETASKRLSGTGLPERLRRHADSTGSRCSPSAAT